METAQQAAITITTTVNAPADKVWQCWNEPKHIMGWAFAHESWHAPHAVNDLRKEGRFTTTMAARDGSMSFDFGGVYTNVKTNAEIDYTMDDGRKVSIRFESKGGQTVVTETFDPETQNPIEMQRDGWQAILDNFKSYTEAQ